MVFAHLWRSNVIVTFLYFFAFNIGYTMCILPDHDTADTH